MTVVIKLPRGLLRWLKSEARANERNLEEQVRFILKQAWWHKLELDLTYEPEKSKETGSIGSSYNDPRSSTRPVEVVEVAPPKAITP